MASKNKKWSTKQKLIFVEIVYFIVDAFILAYYWLYPAGAYTAVGILFTAQFIVSGLSTYLWFVRTDEGDPSGK